MLQKTKVQQKQNRKHVKSSYTALRECQGQIMIDNYVLHQQTAWDSPPHAGSLFVYGSSTFAIKYTCKQNNIPGLWDSKIDCIKQIHVHTPLVRSQELCSLINIYRLEPSGDWPMYVVCQQEVSALLFQSRSLSWIPIWCLPSCMIRNSSGHFQFTPLILGALPSDTEHR